MYYLSGLILFLILLCAIFIIWGKSSRHINIPCPFWLRWCVELENPFTKSNRSEFIIKGLNIEPGMKVMDIGCGPGRLTLPFSKAVGDQGSVIAVDIQQKMLDAVKKKAERNKLTNITYLNIPMGEGKLESQNADRVALITVLGEIPNRELALKEIYDSLKSGGVLAVTEIIMDPHFQNKKTVLDLANPIGFSEAGFFGNKLAFTIYLKKL